MHQPDLIYHRVSDFLSAYAISRSEFYRQFAAGKIRITKLGAATRIAKTDADAWAASLETKGGEALNVG